jgi:hypothetical protein
MKVLAALPKEVLLAENSRICFGQNQSVETRQQFSQDYLFVSLLRQNCQAAEAFPEVGRR